MAPEATAPAAPAVGAPVFPTATARAKPRDFAFALPKTALLVLKMQNDFLSEGGYGSLLGNDVAAVRAILPAVQSLLAAARTAGLEVIHAVEGHEPDLSDVPPSKSERTLAQSGGKFTIGDEGPLGRILIKGQPGTEIVAECAPLEGEKVIVTAAKGVLYNTGLHELLLEKGVTHIVLAGLTAEVGVQLVMRELNDRGFEPCVVEDCTASYFSGFTDLSLQMIVAQGGIIGWTAQLADVEAALAAAKPEPLPPVPDWVPATVPLILKADPPPPKSGPPSAAPSLMATITGARPSPFTLPVDKTAVIVIDMQRDFVLEGGFGSTLGNNVKLLQAIVPTVSFLLETCREHKIQLVHTLEAHLADLSDCPLAKLTRGGLPKGLRIGDEGEIGGRILVRHEWGNDIVDENAPAEGEKVIFKPGKGAFFGTDLHEFLIGEGITHLLFAGVTTEVCVQTSMREGNDRGFHCLMVEDCTESYFPHFKAATLEMLTAQGAIVGWTATAQQFKDAIVAAKS